MWTIIRKELTANLLSLRFILIFLLCSMLILVSVYTMRGRYEKRVREYSVAVNIHRKQVEQNTTEYKLDKPPTPLSVIAEGMEGAGGTFANIDLASTPSLHGGSGGDPMFVYFGTLDVMYIVRVVLSLVAILLTYDAISGEREQGTLKLALSNSVPRYAVLLSKCIGGYITLLLPFLAPMLIGLLILITSGSIDFSGEDWSRLGLVLMSSFLYIGMFLMLGLLVSSRTNRSTTALMILLFVWVVIVLAVPKVSTIVAGRLRDVPSVQEVQAEKDIASAQLMKEGQERFFQYRREHITELRSQVEETRAKAANEMSRIQQDMFDSISMKQQEIQAEYNKKRTEQFRLAANISRLSPASMYTHAVTGLARTSFDRQERFLAAASAYQVGFRQYLIGMMRDQIRGTDDERKFDLDELPALDFQEASLSESWNSVSVDLLGIFLLVACFFMIAYLGFVRSDVR